MTAPPLFTIEAGLPGGTAEVAVRGDLDVSTAPQLGEMLTLALDKQPTALILDVSGVEYLGCAAARVIAQAAHALPAARQLTIRHPPPIVRRLLQLTGLQEIAVIEDAPRELNRSPLRVTASLDGRICLLTLSGDLDAAIAGGLAAQVAQAVSHLDGQAERLVLDLAGLAFLDAAGARALAAVTRAAPPGCPVIVRAISPAAGRLLRLLQLNLEHPQPVAPAAAGPAEHLAQRARAGRAQLAAMTTDLHRTVLELARTEDRLATTFARMAVQYPHRAAQLTALVTAARQAATRSRHLTGHL